MAGSRAAGLAIIVLTFSCLAAAAAPAVETLTGAGRAVRPVAAPMLEPSVPRPALPSPLEPFSPFKQGPDQNGDSEPPPAGPQTRATPPEPGPQVHYGATDLPSAVARMRDALMEAARSGDIERLRPVLEQNEMPPSLGSDTGGDPIDFLRGQSGDPEGREILALLLEILEAGWVHVDAGGAQDMYIWPYFDQWPLNGLSPAQEVELYRILTAVDVEEMRRYGRYIFFRVGIGPDGTLHYFMPSP